ncbi:tripartite tricarboxylate transporter substrate-binding protein [Bradyrhizobium campsiandrae]|uniref:tripartite tricarboxylate transporter substrate-binding protein n=1 Tax=Bradyrhizobium campsiandrae TaxID=1729892 RepID=UPI0024C08EDF|nr:tripartite tricarboxylate transporter substrate-binding protein [Bradyrhizobium campsiandrae]
MTRRRCSRSATRTPSASARPGVSVPAGTDPVIVSKLSEALAAVLADPAIVADLTTNGQVSIADKGPDAMEPFIVEETARYKRVIESASIAAH